MSLNSKKIFTKNKVVFKEYLRDPNLVWLYCDENYKSVLKSATKLQSNFLVKINSLLKKADEFRYKRKILNKKVNYLDYPEPILDGLELNVYSYLHFKEKNSDLKCFLFEFDYKDFATQWPIYLEKTRKLLQEEDNWILFEGCFEYRGFKMRPDVLIKKNGKYHLIEVKATTFPKEDHAYDLLYQVLILEALEINTASWTISLATINKLYHHNKKHSMQDVANSIISTPWDGYYKSTPYNDKYKSLDNHEANLYLRKNIKNFNNFISSWKLEINSFDSIVDNVERIQNLTKNPFDLLSKLNKNWLLTGKTPYIAYLLAKAGVELEGIQEEDDNLDEVVSDIEIEDIIVYPKFSKNSIFSLSGVGFPLKQKFEYYNSGIVNIDNLEDEVLISKARKEEFLKIKNTFPKDWLLKVVNQFQASSRKILQREYLGKTNDFIQKQEITNFLSLLKFPICMFDFETVKFAIPRVDGSKPYEQIPFQYSIHLIFEDGTVEHKSWLAQDDKNYYEQFWENFYHEIAIKYDDCTLVSYNKSFEWMIIKNFIQNSSFKHLVKEQSYFKKITKNDIEDLMIPFKNLYFYNSEFSNSYSIKVVSPFFSNKEIDYSTLKISKGDQASLMAKVWIMKNSMFFKDFFPDLDEVQVNNDWIKMREDMLKYCYFDTLSMVNIYDNLKKIK